MEQIFIFSCIAGVLAIIYGFITAKKVLNMPAGSKKMQEIASAIQEGASALENFHTWWGRLRKPGHLI